MLQTELSDRLFSGVIGHDYDLLKLICPLAAEMSRLVGRKIAAYDKSGCLQVIELGGGTGITTLAILASKKELKLRSIDNEPTMQNQAKKHLQPWVEKGVLTFACEDAFNALQHTASNSVDIVASAYTLHNFLDQYRDQVIDEIFRVLKPGGLFMNGDRYALDNISDHTRLIQQEVTEYFKVLAKIERFDLLQQWVVHLFSDESENHIMREADAVKQLQATGFKNLKVSNRKAVNALLTAIKPALITQYCRLVTYLR
jgi:ubiquinone/menaquinone biosynthesis C-methylase UbiE